MGFWASNLQPNKALFPWLPQPGFWHQKHRNSLQKKPGWTESFDCVLMFFGTDIVLSTQWCSQGMQEKRLNLKLQTHLQEFLLVVRNRVSGQLVFEVLTCEQNNQKEDDILVTVSVNNHGESTNIIFIFFIFNHEHNTTENCLLDMCCMWCHIGTEKVRWCQWIGHSTVENKQIPWLLIQPPYATTQHSHNNFLFASPTFAITLSLSLSNEIENVVLGANNMLYRRTRMCNYELPSEARVIVDSRQPNVLQVVAI